MTKQDAIETLKIFRNDYTREGSAICRAIDIAIDALRQHTIDPGVRLIDANALHAKIYEDSERNYGASANIAQVLLRIETAPTIKPEVRHGEWHECWCTDTVCASICTCCGKAATQVRYIVGQELMTNVRYPLCPNCGAYMEKKGTDND